MKGLIRWIFVAGVGFALMAFSYFNYQYQPGPNPWENAFMYIGKADPNSEAEGLEYKKRPIRLLPVSRRAQNFTRLARSFGPYVEKSYRVAYQEKLILYPDITDDFTDQMLEWGRFPATDANEVVAGFYASNKDKITIDGHMFKVVGQFKKKVRLFKDSYLLAAEIVGEDILDSDNKGPDYAYILRLRRKQLADSQVRQRLKKAFPQSQFATYAPLVRTEQVPFYFYVLGMALLFLGGCVVLFKIYCYLARKLKNKWLRSPFAEIGKYRGLFLTLHLIYFGLVVLFMLVAYCLPEIQVCLLGGIKALVISGSGPLGVAGKAYMSKSMPLAAVVTFLINFFVGSLAGITIPSIIIPGVGVLAAILRAAMWGLLLAPNFDSLSGAMLPHSFTVLLEGEAYIVAAFFASLILVYLFRKAEGPSVIRRYGRALLMNVKGNLLVVMILVIAAIYEAVEVILMMKA